MPPVASTAAQAIFEGLHEDASRSGRTDARLCTGVLAVRVLDNMCVSQSVSQFRRGPPALTTLKGRRLRSPRSTHVRAGPGALTPNILC